MILLPGLFIGSGLWFLAYWVFSLRLPDAGLVAARRGAERTGLMKTLLAYADWLGRGLLDLLPTPARKIERHADRLAVLADRPAAITGVEVVGLTLLAPILATGIIILWGASVGGTAMAIALAIGLPLAAALPALWLNDVRLARVRQLRRGFPHALDLLTLCVEAGMDFTEGMKILAHRSGRDKAIAKLFAELLTDVQMGVPRLDALRRLEHKTGLPEIGTFATVLALADEAGGSVAANLRQLAGEMRNTRLMRAEEFIAKAPVKMVFPVALFLFPVVLMIIFGPIGISLMSSLRF